jgi:type II secretory pathway pseudopilin PulG
MEKTPRIKKLKGMTLLELIIYIVIVAGFVIFLTYLVLSVDEMGLKANAWIEVTDNMRFIETKLTTLLRTADSIDTITSNTLIFSHDGHVYQVYLADDSIFLSQDGTASILNSDKVTIDTLSFIDNSYSIEHPSLSADFSVSYLNPNDKAELNVTQDKQISFTIRK